MSKSSCNYLQFSLSIFIVLPGAQNIKHHAQPQSSHRLPWQPDTPMELCISIIVHLLLHVLRVKFVTLYGCRKLQQSAFANLTRRNRRVDVLKLWKTVLQFICLSAVSGKRPSSASSFLPRWPGRTATAGLGPSPPPSPSSAFPPPPTYSSDD